MASSSIGKVFINYEKYPKPFKWEYLINENINFSYKEFNDFIYVNDYKKFDKRYYLIITYKNNTIKILPEHFKNGYFGKVIFDSSNYLYKIGDIIENSMKNRKIKIIEFIRNISKDGRNSQKAYKYECVYDGHTGIINETLISQGRLLCRKCATRDFNSNNSELNNISITRPDLIKFFKNKEDVYINTKYSKKIVAMVCPICGFEKDRKIADLTANGFCCNICSDGISFSEKFIYSMLTILNINFTYQKTFDWSNKKRYDFYIENYNNKSIIIETHGLQHYSDSDSVGWVDYKYTSDNDRLKKEIALQNGIQEYIEINCSNTGLSYLKKNIGLETILNLSEFNWQECYNKAMNSLIGEVCSFYNLGNKNTLELSNVFKLSRTTIIRYLNIGKELGICNYKRFANSKKIKCINNNKTYNSYKEAEIDLGLTNAAISRMFNKNKNTINNLTFIKIDY